MENKCSICLSNDIQRIKTLSCQHSFHESCINEWFEHKSTCPICRCEEIVIIIEQPFENHSPPIYRTRLFIIANFIYLISIALFMNALLRGFDTSVSHLCSDKQTHYGCPNYMIYIKFTLLYYVGLFLFGIFSLCNSCNKELLYIFYYCNYIFIFPAFILPFRYSSETNPCKPNYMENPNCMDTLFENNIHYVYAIFSSALPGIFVIITQIIYCII